MGLFLSLILIFMTLSAVFFTFLYTALLNRKNGLKTGDMPVADFSPGRFAVAFVATVLLGQLLYALLFGGVIGMFTGGSAA